MILMKQGQGTQYTEPLPFHYQPPSLRPRQEPLSPLVSPAITPNPNNPHTSPGSIGNYSYGYGYGSPGYGSPDSNTYGNGGATYPGGGYDDRSVGSQSAGECLS